MDDGETNDISLQDLLEQLRQNEELLREKESNLILAAEYGQKLLEENQFLLSEIEREKYAAIVTQVTQFRKEKIQMAQEVMEYRSKSMLLQQETESLKSKLSSAVAQQATLMETNHMLSECVENWKSNAADSEKSKDSYSNVLAKLRQENGLDNHIILIFKERLKAQIENETNQQIESLEQEIQKLTVVKQVNTKLQDDLTKIASENEKLHKKLEEQEEIHSVNVLLSSANGDLKRQLEETQLLLNEARATAAMLKEMMDEQVLSQSLQTELHTANSSAAKEQIQSDNKARDELLQQLNAKLAAAEMIIRGKDKAMEEMEKKKKEGYLIKKGNGGLRLWRKRWCILDAQHLFYSEAPQQPYIGMIVLQGANVTTIKDKQHPFRFTVTNRDRSYDFEADSESTMNDWIAAINQVIKACSSLPSPQDDKKKFLQQQYNALRAQVQKMEEERKQRLAALDKFAKSSEQMLAKIPKPF